MPLYPEMLRAKVRIPTISSSIVFTFRLTFESYEKFGGVLITMAQMGEAINFVLIVLYVYG
jgi:hypothetical protein